MTSPEIPARRDRWLRAVGYGLLAEIATILTIVAVVLAYKYVLASPLKIVAGALAGFLYERSVVRNRTV